MSWRDSLLSFHPFHALKVFESGVSGTAWPGGLCYHEEDKQGLISRHEMFLSAGRKDNDHYIEKYKSYCKGSQAGIPEALGEDTQPQALGQAAKRERERFCLGKLERSWVYHCQELPMGREFCLCYRRQQKHKPPCIWPIIQWLLARGNSFLTPAGEQLCPGAQVGHAL